MDSIMEALIIQTGTPPDGITLWVTMKNSECGFEFTAEVVIGTDCTDSYKSNYDTITTVLKMV